MSENPSTLQVKASTGEVTEANLLPGLFQHFRFLWLETGVKHTFHNSAEYGGESSTAVRKKCKLNFHYRTFSLMFPCK